MKIYTQSGAKIICRKSYSGKTVDAIRFEKDARMTEIFNDGEQHHRVQGEVVRSCKTAGRYGWTLNDMVRITKQEITEAHEKYSSWGYA